MFPATTILSRGRRPVLASVLALLCGGVLCAQGLRPPPAPFENLVTAEKAVLGKVLFWDEQLSSDDTMACGTCHRPASGGADPRSGVNPGFDGIFGTADDKRGSPGIVHSLGDGSYAPHPTFGLSPQVTRRYAPPVIGAAWVSTLRWDGKATETFVDPNTGRAVILFGGALENHAMGPPADTGEMAYEGRTWTDIAAKIASSKPLALSPSTSWPADVAQALQGDPDYGELMRRAFGDRAVTPTRIAFALATYQRTLVPDRSPWDRFVRGETNALTPDQQAGLALFEGAARCASCHPGPVFTDGTFRNLGLRPVYEDRGWQEATLDPIDRGKFKVPTLLNVGLRHRYMHNGQFTRLEDVVDFYDQGAGTFLDNKDPSLRALNLSATEKAQLVDFLRHALTDPRVAAEQAPFDRPMLRSELPQDVYGAPHPGSGGIAPRTVHDAPALVGSDHHRLGLADGLGGAAAFFAFNGARGPGGVSIGPVPIHITIQPIPIVLPVTLAGSGVGNGYATLPLPIPADPNLVGIPLHHQAFVVDPGAAGGLSTTAASATTLF